jgi:threonine dehydratase
MRVVACPSVRAPFVRPSGALLESVRNLGARFPDARLRKLTLVRAEKLDARADARGETRVWLALESLQVTGSFKVRGALVAIADELAKDPRVHIVTASAGNHGAGAAYASNVLGARITVYVPQGTPEAKRARIAKWTELVVVDEPGYDACEALAKEAAKKMGAVFLSPYDDLRVACGNGASIAFEMAQTLTPRTVLVPFGGGGLASGMAFGFMHAQAPVAVWGVQSEASPAMAMSLERGSAVTTLPAVETLAEALEGGIAAQAFVRARGSVAGVLVVSEMAIARAMTALCRELGLIVEGGGACAFAALLEGLPRELLSGDLVVLLTGRNVDRTRLDLAMRMAASC